MQRSSRFLTVAALLIPLAGPALKGQEMPEVLYNSDPGVQSPVWISAAAAIDPSGLINALFSAPSRRTIASYFSGTPDDDCFPVEEHYESRVDPPDRSSLARALWHSEFVLLGHITEAAYGFHFYVPGQLLRIKPSRVLHGEALLDSYYIFFPVGEFTAGPYKICKTDSRYPRAPAIGDELLIMVPDNRTRSATDPYLELDEASSVVVLREQEAPDLPDQFKVSSEETLPPAFHSKAELVDAVRTVLSQKAVHGNQGIR